MSCDRRFPAPSQLDGPAPRGQSRNEEDLGKVADQNGPLADTSASAGLFRVSRTSVGATKPDKLVFELLGKQEVCILHDGSPHCAEECSAENEELYAIQLNLSPRRHARFSPRESSLQLDMRHVLQQDRHNGPTCPGPFTEGTKEDPDCVSVC